MAGAPGFEPGNGGIKIGCWRGNRGHGRAPLAHRPHTGASRRPVERGPSQAVINWTASSRGVRTEVGLVAPVKNASCSVEVFPRRPEPWLRLKSTRPAAAVRRHRRDRARLDRAPNRVAIRRSAVHSGHAALRVDLPLRGGFFDQDAVDPLRAGFLGHQPQAEPLAQHAGKEAADRVLLPAGRLHDGRDGRALLALECFEFRADGFVEMR